MNFTKNSDICVKFLEKTRHHNIAEKSLKWYVRHIEAFLKTVDVVEYQQITSVNIVRFLQAKGRSFRLMDWQFAQIVDALKILFLDVLQSVGPLSLTGLIGKKQRSLYLHHTRPLHARQTIPRPTAVTHLKHRLPHQETIVLHA